MQDLLDKAMPEIARRVLNEIIITCPVDTGRLRNSLKVIPTKDGLIIWGVEYLKYVEFGSPPHVIKPKSKKALRFEIGKKERLGKKGRDKNIVFAKIVHHPGNRPNPFIRTMISNKLRKIIIEELQKAQSK